MNTPFDLTTLGISGIGLVWGWWCVLRLRSVSSTRLARLIFAIFTLAWGITLGWIFSRSFGWIFLACAAGSAFFHYWWLHYLRNRYT